MRVRENLSSITALNGRGNPIPASKALIGKVYGVVTTENTPTPEMFRKAGEWRGIGTIFYLDYDQSKTISGIIDNNFLNTCKLSKPLYPQSQYFPIQGELVYLVEGMPSPVSQEINTASQRYYVGVINLWNNNQHNSQRSSAEEGLGVTFVENANIRTLLSFEGDHIIQGRQGNALRFGTTTKLYSNLNEWSRTGNDDNPITILTNGFAYNPEENFYVEKINNDASSIYLTSTQKLPLKTDKTGTLNPLTNPLNASNYNNSQVILNGDRVVINSKRDEVMLFAKTNIELNTQNIINLNADERVHLNSGRVYLGTIGNELPTEPLLLGNKTVNLLSKLINSLQAFSNNLLPVVTGTPGTPAIDIIAAATELGDDLSNLISDLDNITSQRNYTA
jgi:hypothetical protein